MTTTVSLSSELARMSKERGPTEPIKYIGNTTGAFRVTSFFQKFLKSVGLAGHGTATLSRIQGDLGTAGSVFGVLDVPRSIQAVAESTGEMGDHTICLSRRVANLAANGFTALTAVGYSLVFLAGMSWLLAPIRLADLTGDAVEAQINGSNLHEVSQLEGKVKSADEKAAVSHSKKFYMHKTAIKVTSVVLGLIGYAMLVTGVSFVGGLTLSLVSLGLTAVAIKADLLKDPRKLLKCDRTIVV